VVLLFLYHRLYQTATRQLEALKNMDLVSLEDLTREREDVTRELCSSIADIDVSEASPHLSEATRRKIHQLTTQTLDIDAEIKNTLLEELKDRTLELSAAHLEIE